MMAGPGCLEILFRLNSLMQERYAESALGIKLRDFPRSGA